MPCTDAGDAPLWDAYLKDRSDQNRNAIFEHYWPWIRRNVVIFLRQRGSMRYYPDVISYVAERFLATSIPKFDPSLGKLFSGSYRHYQLFFGIMDAMRAVDPKTRRERHLCKNIDSRRTSLSHDLSRRPTDREVSADLGLSESELIAAGQENETQGAWQENLTKKRPYYDGGKRDKPRPSPLAETADVRQFFSDLTVSLNQENRDILWWYYVERWTMAEVGQKVGLTESGVSLRLKEIRRFLSQNSLARSLLCR